MEINGRKIGGDAPCFVVAEAGLAHGGSVYNAMCLIDYACDARADAIKFQVYKTNDLIDKRKDKLRYNRFKECEFDLKQLEEIKSYAESKSIIWFATPHTMSGFEMLEELDVDLYKIGSGERKGELIDNILMTGKPVIHSLGMNNKDVTHVPENVALLHCITQYPVPLKNANLNYIKTLIDRHPGVTIGYSDHTVGPFAGILAVGMGAKIIEKHIKVPTSKGQDCPGALFRADLMKFVAGIRMAEKAMGSFERIYTQAEKENEKWALKNPMTGKRPFV